MPGFADLVLMLIVVLIIFGGGKLPQIATAAGQAIQKLRRKPRDPDEGAAAIEDPGRSTDEL